MSKFKVGDTVKILNANSAPVEVGDRGTILQVGAQDCADCDEAEYSVTVDDDFWFFDESHLELVSPPAKMGGTKHDSGKPPLTLVPRAAIELEAEVYAFGAKKYGRYNYKKGFEYSRLLDAAMRHITAFNDGEDLDPESGKSHLGHARCCIGMLIDCIELGTATDDRYKPEDV